MRKVLVSVIAAALVLSPTSANAASDPDFCNWTPKSNEVQAGVAVRLADGTLLWVGPGFCTDPGQEALRWWAHEGLSFQIKWRDPKTGYSGTRWVDGPKTLYLRHLKHRILDIEVNEKTER